MFFGKNCSQKREGNKIKPLTKQAFSANVTKIRVSKLPFSKLIMSTIHYAFDFIILVVVI